MSIFSVCGNATRTNTGSFDCDEARKIPRKLGIGSKAFDAADTADPVTFKTAIIAASKLPYTDSNKLLFIHKLRDPQDKTSDPTKGKVGDGPEQILLEGLPAFEYSVEIGHDLYKRLRKLNKRRVPIFTYDDSDHWWGMKNASGKLVGPTALFFIYGATQQTTSSPVFAKIAVAYDDANEYHDQAFYATVSLGSNEPEGLLDATLSKVSNATNVYQIDVKAPTPEFEKYINFAEKYSTELASSALFTAKTGATYSTTLVLTSVAYNATLKCLTITFDSTAYTALNSGDKIKLSMVDPATLDAADVTGIEGVDLIIVK